MCLPRSRASCLRARDRLRVSGVCRSGAKPPRDQPARQPFGQPGGIVDVGLVARRVLDARRVRQRQFELAIRENLPDRLPIHPRGQYTPVANTPPWPIHPRGQYTPVANTPPWPIHPRGQYTPVANTPPWPIHPRGQYTPVASITMRARSSTDGHSDKAISPLVVVLNDRLSLPIAIDHVADAGHDGNPRFREGRLS